MSTSALPPQQHKQPSRKGKAAWRKHVDISIVQEGLENVRSEIIEGGVIAEKSSTDLFTLDVTGSASIQKNYRKTQKPLTADLILAQRSAIPAITSHKRPASGLTDGVIEPAAPKRPKISRKEYEHLRKVAYGGDAVEKEVVETGHKVTYDPWTFEKKLVSQDPRFSFVDEVRPVLPPKTLKHAAVTLAASGKPFPAVPKPNAGKSYNPTFTDWDALISREGEKEVEAEKKRLRELEKQKELAARVERAAAEADAHVADAGRDSEWESEWDGIQSEVEAEREHLSRKMPVRKTKAQRNRIQRRKEEERKLLLAARQQKKEQQALHIRALARQVEKNAKAREQTQAIVPAESDLSSDEEQELRRQRFGKVRIPKAPLEVVLADELQDSLRLLKPEGSLLNDRFRSILLRGKMEARRPVSQRKKPRRKTTEKWSYKDWKLK